MELELRRVCSEECKSGSAQPQAEQVQGNASTFDPLAIWPQPLQSKVFHILFTWNGGHLLREGCEQQVLFLPRRSQVWRVVQQNLPPGAHCPCAHQEELVFPWKTTHCLWSLAFIWSTGCTRMPERLMSLLYPLRQRRYRFRGSNESKFHVSIYTLRTSSSDCSRKGPHEGSVPSRRLRFFRPMPSEMRI